MGWFDQSQYLRMGNNVQDIETNSFQVDNATYTWMGASDLNNVYVKQTAYEYTSTRSSFTMSVGGYVEMNITFLSPVTPDELLRSSLPYSYMQVDVQSMDGKAHNVQIYTDISAGKWEPRSELPTDLTIL